MASTAVPQYDIPERQNNLAVFNGSYLTDLPPYLKQWGSSRIVLVASKSLYNNTSHIQRLEQLLGPSLLAKKIGVGPHSPYADVLSIAHLLQTHHADTLISIGSSSYNDASKIATKLAATLPPNFTSTDMESLINQTKGSGTLSPATVKLILIPTSLSAAEWNGTGSSTNPQGKKQHFGLSNMKLGAADLVFCDPVLASTAPASLWLSSGARCIDHCVETICNKSCTPQAESDALQGLREMLKGLLEYKDSSREGPERERFLEGITAAQKGSRNAIKAIMTERNSMGPSHAIGHQLGSVAGVGHGQTSCILLAPTLRYTLASKDPVFERARVGQAKVLEVFNGVMGWQEGEAAGAVKKFFQELGLPTSLGEVGVTDEQTIERVAEATLTDVWGGGEPQIRERGEVRKILDMAR